MFREMRRKKQLLSRDESLEILDRATSGVLAVDGDDGYPYAVPISYVRHSDKIFFHCAGSGHKLDAIARNPKVSFCVTDRDDIVPEEITTYFRSVIVFGTIHILEDAAEKRSAREILSARYSPDHERERREEIDKLFKQTCVLELAIEHMTGKEAFELVRAKRPERA